MSPICSWPWLWMPMMSPATASSLATRSLAMNVITLASLISRPSALVLHLHRRRVAAGAHAEERDAVAVLGVHVRLDLEHEAGERGFRRLRPSARRRRAAAAAAPSRSARCRISCTPKLLMPEPKNTGVCRPARNSPRSNGELALRIRSTSWRSAAHLAGKQLRRGADCRGPRSARCRRCGAPRPA